VAAVLGAVHHAGGEYSEGDKAHSVAGMSEKILKKEIVPKLLEQTTYYKLFCIPALNIHL
jgi:hypothetical protein